jgi:hypothetical protein
MNKKLFPGFPQGDFGALREGVIKTANFFSEDGGEKNKKIANILSVLGDAMQNQQLYQEISSILESNLCRSHSTTQTNHSQALSARDNSTVMI